MTTVVETQYLVGDGMGQYPDAQSPFDTHMPTAGHRDFGNGVYDDELFPPVTTDELRRMEQTLEALRRGESGPMDSINGLLMRDMYHPKLLPLLTAAYSEGMATARVHDGLEAIKIPTKKIEQLAAEAEIPEQHAFTELMAASSEGESTLPADFAVARRTGMEALRENKFLLSEPLQAEADALIEEWEEAESGIEFPPEFRDKLTDPNTHAVAVSLDFNSTFNTEESYPDPDLVARAQRAMRIFANGFQKAYPDKQLYLTLNTGRPGMYIWGAAEAAFPPLPSVRKLAVAETGGVVLDPGFEKGTMQVAVENPQAWAAELDHLKAHLLARIQNPNKVHIEPKLSMLSMRVSDGDTWELVTQDGSPVTPDWIESQVQEYFHSTETALDDEFDALQQDLTSDFPDAVEFIEKAVQSYANGNGEKKKALAELRAMDANIREDHRARLETIDARLEMIRTMHHEGLLTAKYNPTAGYVDIGHAHLNKYNTLTGYICRELGLTPEQVLFLQIGDSSTDILPEENTGPGEVNEGADKAFVVAVENSNKKLFAAVERRGNYGIKAKRPSLLAAGDMFKGLTRVVSNQ